MSEKAAAVITVHRLPEMTEEGRSEIVAWLRRMADWIQETPPEEFDKTLRCRYLYSEGEQA